MARSKKKSLLDQFTNWLKGSIEKLANDGFSKEGKKKRAKAVPEFLKVKGKKKFPKKKTKKNPVKKSAKKTVKKAKVASVPKGKQASAKPSVVAPKGVKEAVKEKSPGIFVGKITHYFPKAGAAVLLVEKTEIKTGAKILIKGVTTNLKMVASSLQINRIPVPSGKPGEDVGLGVKKPVDPGDSVYLLENSKS